MGAVKRALREGGHARVKVGHGGTLDPLASGVLPVALGEATKLAGRMLDADKAYDFTIRFGSETTTLDAEGEVSARSDARPTADRVDDVLPLFAGGILQTPPAYSALLIDGRRAYDRARAGEDVAPAPRSVTIHALRPSAPLIRVGRLDEVALSARVSKGTYIRSLARDIAHALGTVGHVTMLRRTRAGPFELSGAISLDKLGELAMAGALEQALLPLTGALDDIPALPVTPDQASALRQGRTIGIAAPQGPAFATSDGVPVALVDIAEQQVRVVRGFNL